MTHTPLLPSRAAIVDALTAAMVRVAAHEMPQPSESARLREDLGLDSFAAIELMFEVEDMLGVRIPQATAAAFQTVGDVITFVSAELAKPGETADGDRGP